MYFDITNIDNINNNYMITFSDNKNKYCNNINIFDISNIKNKLEKKYKIISKKNNIKRDIYYSQIRDNNKIYTIDYKLIEICKKDKYDIHLLNYEEKYHDKLSFPELIKYHYSDKINQEIYEINNIKLIIENNKIFIKFNKNNIKIEDIDNLINIIIK
jgi:hypothetical protein